MKRRQLRFGKGFRVALGNRHRGADLWLFVQSGRGVAVVNDRRYRLAQLPRGKR